MDAAQAGDVLSPVADAILGRIDRERIVSPRLSPRIVAIRTMLHERGYRGDMLDRATDRAMTLVHRGATIPAAVQAVALADPPVNLRLTIAEDHCNDDGAGLVGQRDQRVSTSHTSPPGPRHSLGACASSIAAPNGADRSGVADLLPCDDDDSYITTEREGRDVAGGLIAAVVLAVFALAVWGLL